MDFKVVNGSVRMSLGGIQSLATHMRGQQSLSHFRMTRGGSGLLVLSLSLFDCIRTPNQMVGRICIAYNCRPLQRRSPSVEHKHGFDTVE